VQKAPPLLSDGASVILRASVADKKGSPLHSVAHCPLPIAPAIGDAMV
jgi:hypothetical protein